MIPCLLICHNRLAYTKQALQSLLESDVDEILIYDNASRDGTVEYLKGLKEDKISSIRFNKTNNGISGAMNWFIFLTGTDEFICKVDNDTLIPKDFCARMLPHMEHADIVQASHCLIKATDPKGFDHWVKRFPKKGDLRYHTFVGGSGIMCRRSVLSDLPNTDWLLQSWNLWQRSHPEVRKAFCTDVEIELLDTDLNGEKYPEEYKEYYKETKRI